MDKCHLPIELCERIIDACYYDGELRSVSYPHWCKTACVCRAWIDRSRFNLLYKVELRKESHVNLLLRTLKAQPSLARFVSILAVSEGVSEYVPFARKPLPELLKNCTTLILTDVLWELYPPRAAAVTLLQYSRLPITKLEITISRGLFYDITRFIWSLSSLQKLSLICDERGNLSTPSCRLAMPPKGPVCDLLEDFKLDHYRGNITFPPLSFGTHVVNLWVCVWDQIADGALDCIGAFQHLQTLYVACSVDRPAVETTSGVPLRPSQVSSIRTLQSILRNFDSTGNLRSLDVRVYSRYSEEERGWTYYVGRAGLLDDLAQEPIVNIVNGSPGLLHLGFELEENDSRYDKLWWTSEILRRFPARLNSTISVRVDYCEYDAYQHLWHTEEEVVAHARAQQTTCTVPAEESRTADFPGAIPSCLACLPSNDRSQSPIPLPRYDGL
ncbi:hypothetical protein C8Q74DRAFT_377631 [Fomes fomentarius]|nr:hypothetical protein C8Q74DRAFT_377631 [Fomes fomentarius]